MYYQIIKGIYGNRDGKSGLFLNHLELPTRVRPVPGLDVYQLRCTSSYDAISGINHLVNDSGLLKPVLFRSASTLQVGGLGVDPGVWI